MVLSELGWNDHFEKLFNEIKTEGTIPARVATVQRNLFQLLCEAGELKAEISGKMRYNAITAEDLPVVGDWVEARVSPGENSASCWSQSRPE